MNAFFSQLLARILKRLSILTLWRFRPGIIGVTGSVGKTSAKLAIAAVVACDRTVRYAKDNLNNELGLPLAILGDWSENDVRLVSRSTPRGTRMIAKTIFWAKVIFTSLWHVVFGKKSSYPEILILEYGADRPGDLKSLLEIARPNISVVTAIGDIPVHVEFYDGPDDVAREKSRLIEGLPSSGFAVLNYDDARVTNVKDRTRANVMTFGFHEGAQVRVGGFEHRSDAGEPIGIAFKLEYGGSFVPVRLDHVFGKAHAYAAATAACVGIIFGMNLVKISEALESYQPPHSRMEIVPGLHGSFVIDDSYNASLLSMQAGLHTLADLPGKRKVAILGDMLELGAYSMEAHEKIGGMAAKCADILITVGARAKMISETVKKGRFAKRNVYEFATVEDAKVPVADLIRKGDLILVKGSRGVRLDELVEVLRAEPVLAAVVEGRGVKEA